MPLRRENQQRIESLKIELNTARAAAELETQMKDIDASLQAGEALHSCWRCDGSTATGIAARPAMSVRQIPAL